MKLTPLLTDHAVIQRQQSIPVWGWTDQPQARLQATLGASRAEGISGDDGRFLLWLPALEAGGPYNLTVETLNGSDRLQVRDILVGEVWLASGQSNMQWAMHQCSHAEEVQRSHPGQIRMINIARRADLAPQSSVQGQWECSSPETTGQFSAVATFFGNRLQAALDVPVGIIHASWGGSPIEAWISRERLLRNPVTRHLVENYERFAYSQQGWSDSLHDRLPADPGNTGLARGWHQPDFDDSDWGTMPVPGYWQQHGHNYSAVIWFRRRVTLPPSMVGRDLTLHLGAVDKHDITYAGGVEVGRTGTDFDTTVHDRIRTYPIPSAQTRDGDLVIAVRAYSFMYVGGLTGPVETMRITLQGDDAGESVPLAGDWRFAVEHNLGLVDLSLHGLGHGNHTSPYMLFENMIKPILPVGIAGAIWYQGENNLNNPNPYRQLLRDLIEDWRYCFGVGDFPFGVVQLPNFQEPADYQPDSHWARLRAGQAAVLDLPRTGLAVTIDCGEAGDIHPRDKKTVGLRLARWALAEVYGREALAGGPLYQDHRAEGNRIRIFFRNVGEGLALKHGEQVQTLVIAGQDLCFRPAQSVIDGRTLLVWHEQIETPIAVRYAWADNPFVANLINAQGEPAGPFCTLGEMHDRFDSTRYCGA